LAYVFVTVGHATPFGITARTWRWDLAIELGTTSVYAATMPCLGDDSAAADEDENPITINAGTISTASFGVNFTFCAPCKDCLD
jgi:hypothetical protein